MAVIREDVIRITFETNESGLETASSQISSVNDEALNAANSVRELDSAMQGASEASASIAEGAGSGITQTNNAIRQTARESLSLRERLSGVRSSLAALPGHAVSRIRQGMVSLAHSARQAVTGGISRLRSGILSLPRAALNGVVNGFKRLGTGIKNLPKNVFNKIVSGVKKLGSGLKSLPKNAFKGLIAGAKKLAKATASAGLSLAKIAGKAVLGGITAVGGAFVGLATKAVNAFGEMEQNVGGSETVFQDLGNKITSINANIQEIDPSTGNLIDSTQSLATISSKAYATMGISQSDYLANLNKMGSLFQGSGLEQQRSLDLSVQAMQRAADVASIMGIDQADALEAVTGAAKGNYTMMDNLGVAMNATTLGAYAQAQGLKKTWNEMSNSEKAELSMKYFFERTSQYAGNFEREANQTVSGSIGLFKAAAQTLVGSLGDSNADIKKLTGNLTRSFSAVVKNVKPVVQNVVKALPTVIEGLKDAVVEFAPIVRGALDQAVQALPTLLPGVINGGMTIMNGLVGLVRENIPSVVNAAVTAIPLLASSLFSMASQLFFVGTQLILEIANGIAPALPSMVQGAYSAVLSFIDGVVLMLPSILSTGINILGQLISGIAQSMPMIGEKAGEIIGHLITGIIGALPQLGEALFNGIVAIITNLPKMLMGAIKGLGKGIMDGVKSWFSGDDGKDASDTGAKTCNSIANGIKSNEATVASAMQGVSATASSAFVLDTNAVNTSTANIGTTFTQSLAGQQSTFDTAMTQSATGASTAFATGMTSGIPSITSAGTNAAKAVNPPFNNINLKPSGEMAGQGFADGLASKKGIIMEKARDIANSVSQTVNKSLDIHSPSRVAVKSARFFDLGLIKGLESLKPKVAESAKSVSNIMYSASEPVRGISTSNVTSRSQSTSNNYSPSFVLNLNGASASDSNKRKVQRWVKESIKESYESMSRTRFVAVEV